MFYIASFWSRWYLKLIQECLNSDLKIFYKWKPTKQWTGFRKYLKSRRSIEQSQRIIAAEFRNNLKTQLRIKNERRSNSLIIKPLIAKCSRNAEIYERPI